MTLLKTADPVAAGCYFSLPRSFVWGSGATMVSVRERKKNVGRWERKKGGRSLLCCFRAQHPAVDLLQSRNASNQDFRSLRYIFCLTRRHHRDLKGLV